MKEHHEKAANFIDNINSSLGPVNAVFLRITHWCELVLTGVWRTQLGCNCSRQLRFTTWWLLARTTWVCFLTPWALKWLEVGAEDRGVCSDLRKLGSRNQGVKLLLLRRGTSNLLGLLCIGLQKK